MNIFGSNNLLEIKQDLKDETQRITANQNTIEALSLITIPEIKNDISINSNVISTNANNVSTNTSEISSISGSIKKLNRQIKKIK
jgi:hypothetical protein